MSLSVQIAYFVEPGFGENAYVVVVKARSALVSLVRPPGALEWTKDRAKRLALGGGLGYTPRGKARLRCRAKVL
jgi:hypothetical protein